MSIVLSYLNQQRQWNDEGDIQHVVNDLNNNVNNVKTLHLTGNTMSVKAAEKLTDPLSKQSKIDKLLWSDLFTGRGKDQIGYALKALSLGLMTAEVHLVELDLSDNAFGPNGVVGVTDLIASPCCYTLKVLNMNNQGLGHQGCRALVKAMKTARQNSNMQGLNLEVFIAGRNRLENEGMEMLSEVFGDGMNSLRKLVLLQNGIGIYGVKGVESLVVAIRNHRNLRILNISDNTIKSNGMNLLSNILPEFESLEEIYMDDCLLGRKGTDMFSLIAEDKSIWPELKIISLTGNEMKSTAAMNLVSAIVEGKPSIEKIDLRENEIKKSYIGEMLQLLQTFDKEHVLMKEEETSDDEDEVCSDAESEEEESENSEEESQGSEEGQNCEESDSETDSNAESEEDEDEFLNGSVEEKNNNDFTNKSESSEATRPNNIFEKSVNDPFAGLFSTPKSQLNIFGTPNASNNVVKTSNDSNNLFGTPTASNTLFGTPKASNNIFGTPKTSGSIFGTPKTSDSIFGTPSESSNLFGTPKDSNNLFGTPSQSNSLFVTSTASTTIAGNTRTNLFSTPSNVTNGSTFSFSQAAKATPTPSFGNLFPATRTSIFSFTDAAKPCTIPENLQTAIKCCLQSESVMSLDKSGLSVSEELTPVSDVLSPEMKQLLLNSVEKGVRVGLSLCEQSGTFDIGLAMIGQLLSCPEKWSTATNAILVEMDCIKSEEKKFVPFCESGSPAVPVKVLKRLLAMDRLSEEVKVILRTIVKNLTKVRSQATDDLLNDLDNVMNKLSI